MNENEGKYLIIMKHGGIDPKTRTLWLQERAYFEAIGRTLRPLIDRNERLPLYRATVRVLISPSPRIFSSFEALMSGIRAESAAQWMVESVPSLWDVGSTDSAYQKAGEAVLQATQEYRVVIVLTHTPIRVRLPELLYAPLKFSAEATNYARTVSKSSNTFPILFDIGRQKVQRIVPL